MNKNFERPELDPSRMPVTEESKDDFLLLVDELTEKSALEMDGQYKEYDLDDERKLMLRIDYHDPTSPVHPEDESAIAIVDRIYKEEGKVLRQQTAWTLLRNRKFLKRDELRRIDNSQRQEEIRRENSARAFEELGLTIASEAEAQEIIEILKQVKEREKDRSD